MSRVGGVWLVISRRFAARGSSFTGDCAGSSVQFLSENDANVYNARLRDERMSNRFLFKVAINQYVTRP